jgi:hypothetical protein
MKQIQATIILSGVVYPLAQVTKRTLTFLKKRNPDLQGLPRYIYYKSADKFEIWPNVSKELEGRQLVIYDGNLQICVTLIHNNR